MSRPDFVLPLEAMELIEKMRSLEERANRVRGQLDGDLAGIRAAALQERKAVAREHARAKRDHETSLRDARRAVAAERDEVEGARQELGHEHDAIHALLESRVYSFDIIADAWEEFERVRADTVAAALEMKSHPAHSAAKEMRTKGRELATARRDLKRVEWVLRLYEWHFPWLGELRETEEELSYVAGGLEPLADADDNGALPDPAQHWLSQEEYRTLSSTERNQRALDRYLRSRKSSWQLGRDYERYVGYLREQAGYEVTYQGIFAGLEDLGRDLICEGSGTIEVVQCKRWSQQKTIHEKHVFQLFGTVVAARIEYPYADVTGTFTTTTTLSERAHQFAKQLGIRVQERFPLVDYPRIKCNIAVENGERIYHLPFDQQYDSTLIESERDECWVATVAEAEELGFRRAWRWRDPSVSSAEQSL
jgi:hypothetical protein